MAFVTQLRSSLSALRFFGRWVVLASIVGVLSGTASILFLLLLAQATSYRENHPSIIFLLPVAGLLIGVIYHHYGRDVVRGNNQLIDEAIIPQERIPFKMVPFILFTTVLTHLFGGSAGREGTGVQMGGAIADQLCAPFDLSDEERSLLLMCGISAGFASIFGTPLAGTVFALELLFIGRIHYAALIPTLFAALSAESFGAWFGQWLGVTHHHYLVTSHIPLAPLPIFYAVVAGISFGVIGRLFSELSHLIGKKFSERISYPPFRPMIGGVIVAFTVFLTKTTSYIGLGVPTIAQSFETQQSISAPFIKIGLTALTLGSGFKGGEVTPLFFIGSTMGSALSSWLPLPIDLLAAMGFVGVFAAASNTPLACLLMGIELFGHEQAIYLAVACCVAYFFAGHRGIYCAQKVAVAKHPFRKELENS